MPWADSDARKRPAESKDSDTIVEEQTAQSDEPTDGDPKDVSTESTTSAESRDDGGTAESDDEVSLGPGDNTEKRAWAGPVVKALGAVIAVAILAGAVVLGWLWKEQRDKDIAAWEALAAAQQFARVLTNVDSGKIDENFAATIDGSTGEFKDMYTKSSAQLRQILVKNKALAHGMVVESAVKCASRNKVEVLLFIDQSVSNVAVPDPGIDRSRVRMTMEKIDGRWLASKVELI